MAAREVTVNRKAYHDYFIDETMEAGISLTGSEIKSVRAGKVSVREAYVKPQDHELWLWNAHIAPYEAASFFQHEPRRPRRLLLHRDQITYLTSKVKEKGYTLVPLKLYFKERGNYLKVEIGLARGKKQYDKREAIAKRDAERDMDHAAYRRR